MFQNLFSTVFPLISTIYSTTLYAVMQKSIFLLTSYIQSSITRWTASLTGIQGLSAFSPSGSVLYVQSCTHILVASTPYITTRGPAESDCANISHVIVLAGCQAHLPWGLWSQDVHLTRVGARKSLIEQTALGGRSPYSTNSHSRQRQSLILFVVPFMTLFVRWQ